MPLQNRVDPWGVLHANDSRGTWMGNRGILHDDQRRVVRDQRLRAWIICRLQFKGRRREVMSPGQYTELFFLDEATALAAGHRPCFECRRDDASRFRHLWRQVRGDDGLSFPDLDAALNDDRRLPRAPMGTGNRVYRDRVGRLPDGALVDLDGHAWLVADHRMLRWSFDGYDAARDVEPDASAWVLTPRTTVTVLRAGYRPHLHASAVEQLGSRA
jgi:hypothetical protein